MTGVTDNTDCQNEKHELFVPGRVCLFGEHSDWAGSYRTENSDIPVGLCLISGTDQGLYARVSRESHNKLKCHSVLPTGEITMEMDMSDDEDLLTEAASSSLWSYICGTTFQIKKRYPGLVGGICINNYKTTLPVKKGLSSSAAICVLTARAFNIVYNLNLSTQEEMYLAYVGETTTLSKCGRMDQGCAYGSNIPILMKFDGEDLHVDDSLTIGRPIHLIIVDLHSSKNTPAILRDLRTAYPKAKCSVSEGVQALLGKHNHVIMAKALEALKEGSAEKVGKLMVEAQALFDKYAQPASPEHLSSPVLHSLLKDPRLKPYVHGGKGVGSQGDGSAQFVAKSEADRTEAMRIIEEECGMSCLPLTLGVQAT